MPKAHALLEGLQILPGYACSSRPPGTLPNIAELREGVLKLIVIR